MQPRGIVMLMSSTSMFPVQLVARSVDLRWLRQWAPLPLRLIVGYGFIAHGYAKFSRGPETFAVVLHTIGTPIPLPLAWLTTLVEMIGGLAVMIGAFVPMVSLPMAVVLLTALFTIHLPYGFFSVKLVEVTANGTKFGSVGYEIILLYLAGLTALVLGGAGPLSIDRWRSRRRARTRFATRPSMGQSAACNREIGEC
jgi:putative oxidoreductase